MALKIEWSIKAERTFDKIIDFILKNWSEKEVKKFLLKKCDSSTNIDFIELFTQEEPYCFVKILFDECL